jgi:hypothetical protein
VNRQMDPDLRKQSVLDYFAGKRNAKDVIINDNLFKDNDNCLSHGMDQGIHNWLLYAGMYFGDYC